MSSSLNSTNKLILDGKRIAFVGKLGGVTKREAQTIVRDHGGTAVDKSDRRVDLIVVGADELPLVEYATFLDDRLRDQIAAGIVEIIGETEFWQRMGFVEGEQNVRRLYTPAMLADLLDIPVAVIRKWHRRKLIVPAREVRRLPYFDFQEVATARHLAQLLAAGASPASIEKKLAQLSRYVPDVERPLAQLSVIIEGKQLLLRQGEGLIEPGGQLRIDFDAIESETDGLQQDSEIAGTLSIGVDNVESLETDRLDQVAPEELFEVAVTLEDEGQLQPAANMYRAALTAGGPRAEVCFHLAELLYRMGDLSGARERYYICIELDEDYVEARANLGCVLAEMGELELAVAAFEGALEFHSDYPDVHYHLARTLDEMGEPESAEEHWQEFLNLAPDSPWSNEARDRLNEGFEDV